MVVSMYLLHQHTALISEYRTEQNRICITLILLQLHTYTTIYNFGDKTGHNNTG